MLTVIYHRKFAMGFPGMQMLHFFDSYRARRAYEELKRRHPKLRVAEPTGPVTDAELRLVHSQRHLDSLRSSLVVAQIIEVVPFALFPRPFLDWILVTPMRWAVNGTLLAVREALEHGIAISLSGGFHHAKPDKGEGFCMFSDIGYAIQVLRGEGKLARVLYVDLDAHQGNGVCHVFQEDRSVQLFDIYNGEIYPVPNDEPAVQRLDASFPMEFGAADAVYMQTLEENLPAFLDQGGDLVLYNAGTDVVTRDPLGGLNISPEAILRRDLFVIREARKRNLPVVMLPSGGYTRQSFMLICATVSAVYQEFGGE